MKKRLKLLNLIKTKGKILKIVSNPKRGSIKVYDEKGKIVIKKTNLSQDQIQTIEDHLVGFITTELNGTEENSKNDTFDPMVT